MKTIYPTEILDYYDGIQLFAGRDKIGGHYIGSMVDTVSGVDRYLVTGAAPERLRQFRSGMLDLRTLLLEAPYGEWYLTLADGEYGDPLALQPQDGPLDQTDFLPEAGFLLDDTPIDDLAKNVSVPDPLSSGAAAQMADGRERPPLEDIT